MKFTIFYATLGRPSAWLRTWCNLVLVHKMEATFQSHPAQQITSINAHAYNSASAVVRVASESPHAWIGLQLYTPHTNGASRAPNARVSALAASPGIMSGIRSNGMLSQEGKQSPSTD